jgi:hypothetical protein
LVGGEDKEASKSLAAFGYVASSKYNGPAQLLAAADKP